MRTTRQRNFRESGINRWTPVGRAVRMPCRLGDYPLHSRRRLTIIDREAGGWGEGRGAGGRQEGGGERELQCTGMISEQRCALRAIYFHLIRSREDDVAYA